MKIKKLKTLFTICVCLIVLSTFSCEMFSTSLFKDMGRDLSEVMKNASTEDLISNGTNPDILGDQQASQAALEALGEHDLTNITPEDATNVCTLATSAILPTSTLMDAIETITNASQEEIETEVDALNLINSILTTVPEVDTSALEQVLGNDTLVQEAEISSVAMATVSLMASALANENLETEQQLVNIETITQNLQNVTPEDLENAENKEELISTVLSGTDFEDNPAMETAISAVLTLKDREDLESLSIFGFNIGELFGSPSGNMGV